MRENVGERSTESRPRATEGDEGGLRTAGEERDGRLPERKGLLRTAGEE